MSRSFKFILLFLILIILGGLSYWYYSASKYSNSNNISKKVVSSTSTPAKEVRVLVLKKQSYNKSITAEGVLINSEKVSLVSQQSGTISGIYFKNGQKVKKGDLLIQIDDQSFKQDMNSKYARMQEKKDFYERNEKLSSKSQALISRSNLNKARQDYLSALADYNFAKVAVDQTKITAPFDGVMGALTVGVNIGSQVSSSDILVYIVNPNNIEVRYSLNQKYFGRVHNGQLIDVYLNQNTNKNKSKKIEAVINFVASQVDQVSNSFEIRALLKPSQYNVAGGMLVDIKQVMKNGREVIFIPGISILPDAAGFHVFIVEQGKAVLKNIVLGEARGDQTVVTKGLEEGQKLIISGQQSISDGAPVQII